MEEGEARESAEGGKEVVEVEERSKAGRSLSWLWAPHCVSKRARDLVDCAACSLANSMANPCVSVFEFGGL